MNMMKVINRRYSIVSLFLMFSYVSNMLWFIADLLPPFIRRILFALFFKKFGHHAMIDYKAYIRYPWKVSIGNNVAINRGCELYASMQSDAGYITLEDHVVLGPNVTIFSATHDYSSLDLPDTSAPVVICRDTWIGGNSTILPGVVIGEGAVVGAGSVVSKDIPPFTVAVGNPAKVIKNREIKASDPHMTMNLEEHES